MKKTQFFARKVALITVLTLFSVNLSAQGGMTGPLSWNISNGTLTISGNGTMPDYSLFELAPWAQYQANISTAVIENGVLSIGDWAFIMCTALTSITLPESITRIGEMAFTVCTALTSITVPKNVASIGDNAFTGCTALPSINVHGENQNFSSENGVLFDKNKMLLICYPAGKPDKDYSIPSSVTTIGDNAFSACIALTSVMIPGSVTNIGYGVFSTDTVLTSINVSNDNQNYASENGVLFDKNKTLLICYPAGKKDKDYVIPNSVTSIDEIAFHVCSALSSLTIPESVTEIGDYAFRSCTSLTSITNLNPVPVSISGSVFAEVDISACTLKVPESSVAAYQNANVWQEFILEGIEIGIENMKSDAIHIYPNPTTEQLTINNEQLTINNIEIYDIMGKKQEIIVNYQLSIINCSHLPDGIYFVKITTNTGNIIKKVVKQ